MCGAAVILLAVTKAFFFFDTEDYTSDRANDSIVWFADLLTQEGLRGNFAVVGFLGQRITELGRRDVVESLRPHCIGSQTLYHSRHPTICEYADVPDWSSAYNRTLAEEAECCGMLKAAFGRDAVAFFVPPGPSVPSTVFYAYADMGVEIAAATSDIFAGEKFDRLIWYCNQLHIPYFYHYTPEEFTNDALAKRRVVAFYTHPNQLLFKDFWDGVNYAGANLCEWRKWKPSRPLEPEKTEAMKEEWRTLVRRIRADARFRVMTAADLKAELKPRGTVVRAMVPELLRHIERGLEPMEAPISLCVADIYQAAVRFLRGETEAKPGRVHGFLERPVGVAAPVRVKRTDLEAVARALDLDGFIPPSIPVGGVKLGPADFLIAALKVLAEGADEVEICPRDQLGPVGKHLPALPTLKLSSKRWPIYPRDFEDRYVTERLRLQFWTLRYED